MKIATLTEQSMNTLRPALATIEAALARRGDPGARVPTHLRPPPAYSPGAIGWTSPVALYPQTTGAVVVVMEDTAWSRLNQASRDLFAELSVVGYPPGFHDGEAVAP